MARTLSFLLKIQPPTYGKLTTILNNVDGGGARQIIPRKIFNQLEKELQVLDDEPEARLVHYLDVIAAGRSSGGLTGVMLTAPNEQNRPLFAAKDINKFYLQNCPYIFSQRRGIFTSFMVIPTSDIKKLHCTVFSRHQCSPSNTLNKLQSKPSEEALSEKTIVKDSATTPSEKSVNLINGFPVTAEAQQLSGGTLSTSKNPKQAVIDSTPATPSKKNTNPIDGLPPTTNAQQLSDVTPDTNKDLKPAVADSTTIPAIALFPANLTLPENFQMSINIGTTITVNYYGK